MAELSDKGRKQIKDKNFGLPGKGDEPNRYPVHDKAHAANAKARAAQQVKKGNITPAEKKRIDSKANKKLGGK
jgi:hypothetical protein